MSATPTLLYAYGTSNPLVAPVATAQAVNKGDIVGLNAGTVVRAEDTAAGASLAATQTTFAALFAGISAQVKLANVAQIPGNAGPNVMVVNTGGVYTAPCASTTFNVGDYVGPGPGTGFLIVSQTVAKVSGSALAIGRVVLAGTNLTQVTFAIISTTTPIFS